MTDLGHTDSAELIRRLTSGDSDRIVEAVRAIAQQGVLEAVPVLLDVLDSTNDGGVWNAIAIALADMGILEAKEHIVALLNDSKTVGNRGSLLYALQQGLDYRDESPMLTEMCISGNLEVRGEAATMLVAIAGDLTSEERSHVTTKLRQAENSELSEFFCEVLEDFEAAAEGVDLEAP